MEISATHHSPCVSGTFAMFHYSILDVPSFQASCIPHIKHQRTLSLHKCPTTASLNDDLQDSYIQFVSQ